MEHPQVFGRREWLADLTAAMSVPQNPTCRDFEFRYRECGMAYGYQNSLEKCQSYLEDLKECVHASKRFKRVVLMRQTRDEQMRKGERGYLPLPRSDLLQNNS